MKKRLKICYVVPGHDLVSTVGPTRNVLSLAYAMNEMADVTVAFRKAIEPENAQGLRLLEIQPEARKPTTIIDDASTRGMSVAQFARFLFDLRRFSRHQLNEFDIVLEKSWMLSGFVCGICRRNEQPAIAIENYVPNADHSGGGDLLKRLRVQIGDLWAGYLLRGHTRIIAETAQLKSGIADHWRVPENRIEVVSLGVDRTLFSPTDQNEARLQLGLPSSSTIMLYVGTLDATHDLAPLLSTLKSECVPHLELHIVGDGRRREEYVELARHSRSPVTFHGRVAHTAVPKYISASDICLAPYDATAFKNEQLGYSTMKIPEYLSVGRPVIAVESGRTRELVDHGKNGFLFDNKVEKWMEFLKKLPSRERLAVMAAATSEAPLMSWADTAQRYMDICLRELTNRAVSKT